MKTVSIVGFGRFAKTLIRLFDGNFELSIYTRREQSSKSYHGATFVEEEAIFGSDVIIYAVPIRAFESVIRAHAPHYKSGQIIIDVLSVKMHPQKVIAKYCRNYNVRSLSLHPMFGPDSSKHGFQHLPMIMCPADDKNLYDEWKLYFESKGLRIVEMTAEEHDKEAADSLGLTHTIGRLLQQYNFKPTRIDSLGAKKLKEIMDQVTNDSWELYEDMIKYNPYAKDMLKRLKKSFESLPVL